MTDYEILKEKYDFVCEENKKLKKEIQRLYSLYNLSSVRLPDFKLAKKLGATLLNTTIYLDMQQEPEGIIFHHSNLKKN